LDVPVKPSGPETQGEAALNTVEEPEPEPEPDPPPEQDEPDPSPEQDETVEKPEEQVQHGVEGTLFDLKSGMPLTGRVVVIEVRSSRNPEASVRAEVDPETGGFRFSALFFGSHEVRVEAEGYLPYHGRQEVPLSGAWRIGLERGGAVRIKVTDRFSRRLSDVRFFDYGDAEGANPRALLCRREGAYFIVGGLEAGTRRIAVEAPGRDRLLMEVLVSLEEDRTYLACFE
jgi:hypothetical protein